MRGALTIWVLFSATAIFAQQSVRVAVCNMSQASGSAIEHAKAEAAYTFRDIDVDIHWMDCAQAGAQDPRLRPDYIVRVHPGGKIAKAGPASLESMGRAFMDSSGDGFMADTYIDAIKELALRFPLAGRDQLLGFVMTHELGHLLIGVGHRPDGIMRASWGKPELEALNRRHLKFSDWERTAIHFKLREARAVAPASLH